jgi:hypothetical protein
MSAPKRRSLQIDDPLEPSRPPKASEPLDEPAITSSKATENGHARAAERPSTDGVWRTWSGVTGVGSFRLPHELLIELGDTARELQLPIGMIVTAAITELLDQPPDTIATLVDRADDARIQGRRQARRHRTESAGD